MPHIAPFPAEAPETDRVVAALTVAVADALSARELSPADRALIAAVRAANEELLRLAAALGAARPRRRRRTA